MEDQIKERAKALKKKRRNRSLFPAAVAGFIAVALIGGYAIYQKQFSGDTEDAVPIQPHTKLESAESPSSPQQRNELVDNLKNSDTPVGTLSQADETGTLTEQLQAAPTPASEASQQTAEPEDQKDIYLAAVERIRQFYSRLDQRRYIREYQLKTSSETYFSSLAQKALDNPPIVSGETDDLFNILKNTAHFFRVVGKQNITIIKSILHEEKRSYEHVLADYYLLSENPEYLEQEFALQITDSALLDYAGFFLNTMGGRLYLFRRDSVSRMLVNYYAIRIVDEANMDARNNYGLDIRPAIDSLIDDMESSNAVLQLKEEYLDTLYGLQEKY